MIKDEKNYIHAVFKTGGMKFKDDAEFYFDERNKLIHFRSASRVGYSDIGLNRKRYNKINIMINKFILDVQIMRFRNIDIERIYKYIVLFSRYIFDYNYLINSIFIKN